MAYKRTSPMPVIEGGTGQIAFTPNAPIIAGATSTSALVQTTTGLNTAGFVLTANASGAPTFQGVNGGVSFINTDNGMVAGDTITLTGGTSGAVFTGSGSTITESFNYLALPTATSANGQIKINSLRFAHNFGSSNTFLGSTAGAFTGSGGSMVGIGFEALNQNTGSCSAITAIGSDAFKVISGASQSIAIGVNAGALLTTTVSNSTIIGTNACASAGTGFGSNVVIGSGAMTGSTKSACTNNVVVGSSAGTGITSGSNNLFMGAGSGVGVVAGASNINLNAGTTTDVSNQLNIGAGTGTGTQQINASFIHGIRGITTVNNNAIAVVIDSAGQLGTVSSSIAYKENVEDMNDVSSPLLNLRPVTFDFKNKRTHKKQVGLIAEEVEQVMPSLVAYNQDGAVETVKYHEISSLLLNELKKALGRIEFLEHRLKNK